MDKGKTAGTRKAPGGEPEQRRSTFVQSIKENVQPSSAVPDFRNLGVVLRVLLAVNLLAAVAVMLRNDQLARLPRELVECAAVVEPALIAALVALYAIQPWLARQSEKLAYAAIGLTGLAAALAFDLLLYPGVAQIAAWELALRIALWSLLASAAVLFYLRHRQRAQTPALAEARLLALTARIRPHFFFNSLNAVLGVMRTEPRQAEQALESLAELFRVLMAENRELTALGEELALCRQYLELERLRLGERLQVKWTIEDCPPDMQIPPLMLQPLLENAVYHGVEPSAEPAAIGIRIARRRDIVEIEISNPYHAERGHQSGNRMALENIRERLMLFFDLEARLETGIERGLYRVRITLPYRRDKSS